MKLWEDNGVGDFHPTPLLGFFAIALGSLAAMPTLRGVVRVWLMLYTYVATHFSASTLWWIAGIGGWSSLLLLCWCARRQLRILKVQRELRRSIPR
jgi:formate hydrogenlyase subunit 3/multisubunit Na+/H+ antiporter MnhD subunit